MKNKNEYIISDTHFFHSNIIRYCGRPYDYTKREDIFRMNEDILKLFDSLPDEDNVTVWNLGDVFFSKMIAEVGVYELKYYVGRMKGTRRKLNLVLGNHDKTILKTLGIRNKSLIQFFTELGFDKVYDHPIIIRDKYILCHEPVYIGKKSPFKVIYGHTHNTCVDELYHCIDLENWAMEARAYRKNGLEPPEKKIVWPERKIDIRDYYNVCLDHANKILRLDDVISELESDTYKGQKDAN